MNIKLKKLVLKNFKGIRDKEISFSEKTSIYGANRLGKTTLSDAYYWLIFDKDSKGVSKFGIKTIENDVVLHGLDHCVKGEFEVKGKTITFAKIYKEKWVKSRGASEKVMNGHTTEHFINNVPVKKKDYDTKVNELFDKELFATVSDPRAFANLDWKKRRETLFKLDDNSYGATMELVNPELENLLSDKTLEELKAEMTYSLKHYIKDKENIPIRIDTLNDTLVDVDSRSLTTKINFYKGSLSQIEEKIENISKLDDEKLSISQAIYEKKVAKQDRINQIKSSPDYKVKDYSLEIKSKEAKLKEFENARDNAFGNIDSFKSRVSSLEKELSELREKVKAIHYEEFDKSSVETTCPLCKRELEDAKGKIEEFEKNFNKDKARRIELTTQKGIDRKSEKEEFEQKIKKLEDAIKKYDSEIIALEKEINELRDKQTSIKPFDFESIIADDEAIKLADKEIAELEEKLSSFSHTEEVARLKSEKAKIQDEIEQFQKQLARIEANEETKAKIKALEDEEIELVSKIGECERILDLIKEQVITNAKAVEESVNKHFSYASFKLFEPNLTNDGITEVCTIMVDGVDYSDVNTAGQINAGLDIINTLSKHYDYKVPIWIDNRESVTKIIDVDTQVINLIVSEKDKTLRVEKEK